MKDCIDKSKNRPITRFHFGFFTCGSIAFISAIPSSSLNIGGPNLRFVTVLTLFAAIVAVIAVLRGGWLLKVVNAIFSGGPFITTITKRPSNALRA